jgi:hypothetical protein
VRVLEAGCFATELRSYVASRDRILACVSAWPARACARLQRGHAPEAAPAASPQARLRLLPYLARIARRRLARAWERLFRHPQWTIGVLRRPAAALVEGEYGDEAVEWIPPDGRRSFLADPFGLERDGRLQVLCEEFPYREGLGRIRAIADLTGARSAEREPALELSGHASYPFLLETGGGIYCVPETAAAGEIALFRAEEFPHRWSKADVLVEGFAGIDPTVFEHGGSWWLLCTRQGRLEDVELFAFHAPDLRGPWTPHARNPVKTDVRGARPAGPPFLHGGELYRPAQDCSRRYGWRVAIQRVARLTPTEFAEEPVAVLEPAPGSPYPLGRHTLCPVGDAVLVDGLRHVFVWAAFRAFLRNWLGR